MVGWVLDAGMYAIVNIHWDGGWIDSEGKSTQYTLTSDAALNMLNQLFVTTVRAQGGYNAGRGLLQPVMQAVMN